jgi:hypothetical protein
MKLKVVDNIGPPHIVSKRENGVGTIFDLELPIDIHIDLITACARYVFHNGTDEQRTAFKFIIASWSEVV